MTRVVAAQQEGPWPHDWAAPFLESLVHRKVPDGGEGGPRKLLNGFGLPKLDDVLRRSTEPGCDLVGARRRILQAVQKTRNAPRHALLHVSQQAVKMHRLHLFRVKGRLELGPLGHLGDAVASSERRADL